MLGTTDKYRIEKVWYEVDMVDILRGASILTCDVSSSEPLLYIHTQELVSNGETTHKVRALVSNGRDNSLAVLGFLCHCSDGSERYRFLRIRVKQS